MMAAPYRIREEDPNCCRISVTSLVISLIPRQGKEYEPCFTSENIWAQHSRRCRRYGGAVNIRRTSCRQDSQIAAIIEITFYLSHVRPQQRSLESFGRL